MGLALVAVSVLSTAASISSNNKNAKSAQNAAITRQTQMSKQSQLQQQEINEQTSLELTNLDRKAKKEKSTIENYNVESGVTGVSKLREEANAEMQKAFNQASIVSEGQSKIGKVAMGEEATRIETQSKVNQLQNQKTSGLSSMLQLATAGVTGYTAGKSL